MICKPNDQTGELTLRYDRKRMDQSINRFPSIHKEVLIKDQLPYILSAQLHSEAARLICRTIPLQDQLIQCYQRLHNINGSEQDADNKEVVRDILDEIFGCDIEIQCLHRSASKFEDQAHTLVPDR
jgi:hypothetical protein